MYNERETGEGNDKMKKIFFLLFLLLFLVGCTQQEIKEGQVYVVQEENSSQEESNDMLNIEGRIPFQRYVHKKFLELQDSNQVILTISSDGKEIYLMEKMEKEDFPQVIMGETGELIRIIRQNTVTGEKEIVAEGLPFISRVLWNTEGDKIAFGGGERLTIYDVKNHSLLMKEELEQDIVTDFFWSPVDSNKLYSEEPDLANGSIYYLASQKKVEAYETREEAYFKGKLDSSYYFGTKWDLVEGKIKTVILDKQGKVMKVLTTGRFRDAYQRSLVVVGEGGFGLYYILDINRPEERLTLTKEYIYDVKFVTDGKIVYTTKAEDLEDNLFYLHIVSSQGEVLKKLKVQGGSIAVSPDGATGYISGPVWQQVDFVESKLEKDVIIEGEETGELEGMYSAIRGGMITLYDFQLKGERNWDRIKMYFVNSQSPQQWASFDVEKAFIEGEKPKSRENYVMKIHLKNSEISASGDRGSVTIGVKIKNSYGRTVAKDYALELIKIEGKWYITGFSTFASSIEAEEMRDIVTEVVNKIQKGDLFSGKLQNREIQIGQIQFWLNGVPHLAPNVEGANAVKVYLQVKEQDREEIYKLVLEKVNQKDWQPTKLTKENLSTL